MRASFSRSCRLGLAAVLVLLVSGHDGQARPQSLDGQLIVGFQGWFACPGDGHQARRGGWVHWFRDNRATADKLAVELLPETTEFPSPVGCRTEMVDQRGLPIRLFTDQDPATVLRQFEWMRDYGIAGVALQRFVVGLGTAEWRHDLGRVLENVRRAAEGTGRVFFITYDTAGVSAEDWPDQLAADWQRLLSMGVTDSPAYARHRGHPVLGLAGPGFRRNRPATPSQIKVLLDRLRQLGAARDGLTLVGLLPKNWRTLDGDSRSEPAWGTVYRSFDIISPWLVGSMGRPEDVDSYVRARLTADLQETRRLGIDFMPTVFPGFSWSNLTRLSEHPGRFNAIPRDCGGFFWHQVRRYRAAGVTMLYGAMFDEVDEGTALFKLQPDPNGAPAGGQVLNLDVDGCNLQSDWYLRLAGAAAQLFAGDRTLAASKPPAPAGVPQGAPTQPATSCPDDCSVARRARDQ